MAYTTLITAGQLRELGIGRVVVLDASFDLADADAGERSYRQEHLPRARYVHLERDLSAPKNGRNGRHPLPRRESFARLAGSWGITPDTQVVVYDRQQAMFAARAWWMLRWLGHDAVAVLDGGLAAWQAAGGAVDDAAPEAAASQSYPQREPLVASIDADHLMQRLGRVRLIDARAPERYRGEVEPLDAQAGHIPAALNRFFQDNLAHNGCFKPRDQLRSEFEPLLAGRTAEVIHQCGSGVTACHNVLAMEWAGLGPSTLYAGSWSEWSADPSRPIARS